METIHHSKLEVGKRYLAQVEDHIEEGMIQFEFIFLGIYNDCLCVLDADYFDEEHSNKESFFESTNIKSLCEDGTEDYELDEALYVYYTDKNNRVETCLGFEVEILKEIKGS